MSLLLLGRMGISRWDKLWIMDGKMFEGWIMMMDGWHGYLKVGKLIMEGWMFEGGID